MKQLLDPGLSIGLVLLLQVITHSASFLLPSQISQVTPQTFPAESTPSSASFSTTSAASRVEWKKVPRNTLAMVAAAAEGEDAHGAAMVQPGRNERYRRVDALITVSDYRVVERLPSCSGPECSG